MRISAAVSRPGAPAPAIEQVELAEPRAGEMRVRIVAVGVCHTDVHEHPGRLAPHPIVLGHEGAGVIDALGEGVRGFEVGDHVVLSGTSCGECVSCLNNRPTYCDLAMPLTFGGKRLDGSTSLSADGEQLHSHFFGQSSFASHAIVPERTAVKVAKDVPLDMLGPLACGVITGAGSVIEALRVGFGDSIAIFGVGGVGLSAVMAARLVGAERIIAVDREQSRLDMARALGATDTLLASDDVVARIREITGRGVRYTLNTTNAPVVHTQALDCLAMNGTAAFVSAPMGQWAPAMFPMLAGGRQLRGILGGDANPRTFLPRLIEYWRQGRFPFERMIRTYRFDEIGEAFDDVEHGRTIKPVLLVSEV